MVPGNFLPERVLMSVESKSKPTTRPVLAPGASLYITVPKEVHVSSTGGESMVKSIKGAVGAAVGSKAGMGSVRGLFAAGTSSSDSGFRLGTELWRTRKGSTSRSDFVLRHWDSQLQSSTSRDGYLVISGKVERDEESTRRCVAEDRSVTGVCRFPKSGKCRGNSMCSPPCFCIVIKCEIHALSS